ncbi:ubiquitin-like-conjugating enzyme atg10 [Holotrichia oblita]|uniref:Ubiquitin-like-conjugating enzyme atg10 n=1 Tax=Holotrichia oblita TaxID=644536 RepID=A0ACB9T258_HOLOL|nr:ubiquitin-like-conjugating enzyme atg10 [Holotrichia oblita]
MQITWETFKRCIEEFQDLSNELNDTWIIHKPETEENFTTYLTKKQFITPKNFEEESSIPVEYHVMYSISYGTPILCLNSWRNDGTLLTMEELWKCLNFTEDEDMYSTLTQMDHPILQRPFLTLHPCRTGEILENMFKDSRNIIVSWLSLVGPIVKLDVDLNYMKLT